MHLVCTRQFILMVSVWFAVAFPWACVRHCATLPASTHHAMQFVCQLQLHDAEQLAWGTTLSTNALRGSPSLTLFVLTSSIVLQYVLHNTAYPPLSLHWHTCYVAIPVPPPKSA